MKSVDSSDEFEFVKGMPKAELPAGPKDLLQARINALSDEGMTQREMAEFISPLLSLRTFQKWVTGERLPPDWVCLIVVEKLGKVGTKRR